MGIIGRAESGRLRDDKRSLRFAILFAFLLSFVIPIRPEIFGLRIDPYRFLLLVLYFPILTFYIRGRAGRASFPDLLIALFCVWIIVSFLFNHGLSNLPYAIMTVLEYSGGYFLGRILVRNYADFRLYIFFIVFFAISLVPFALIELFFGRNLFLEIIPVQFRGAPQVSDMRLGLHRASAGFPHAILFGLVCSVAVANLFFLRIDSNILKFLLITLVICAVFTSLSSGPWLSVAIQIFLILWARLTQSRWWLLISIFAVIYFFFEIFSNRGFIIFFFENFSLRPMSGWWRVHIWNYGTENVLDHPFFGIGLNDWDRPEWLSSSVDNFWLLIAMRHGFPAIILLGSMLLIHIFRITREERLEEFFKSARTGYIVAFFGTVVALGTVHMWDSVVVFMMIYIGAGAFFYNGGVSHHEFEAIQESNQGPAYTRQKVGSFRRRAAG